MRSISSLLPIAAWSAVMTASAGLALAAPEGAQPRGSDINKQTMAQASGDPQQAQWTQKKQTFFYQGFTSYYSCDSMRDQIFDVLKQLGARRSDLKVAQTGCSGSPDRPSHFPGANIRMSVLGPAKESPGSGAVSAHWHAVNLKLGDNFVNDAGSCELIAEIARQIVPLFTTRNVDLHADCFAHQLSLADHPTLKLEVLMPDQDAAKR